VLLLLHRTNVIAVASIVCACVQLDIPLPPAPPSITVNGDARGAGNELVKEGGAEEGEEVEKVPYWLELFDVQVEEVQGEFWAVGDGRDATLMHSTFTDAVKRMTEAYQLARDPFVVKEAASVKSPLSTFQAWLISLLSSSRQRLSPRPCVLSQSRNPNQCRQHPSSPSLPPAPLRPPSTPNPSRTQKSSRPSTLHPYNQHLPTPLSRSRPTRSQLSPSLLFSPPNRRPNRRPTLQIRHPYPSNVRIQTRWRRMGMRDLRESERGISDCSRAAMRRVAELKVEERGEEMK
jgi:hypothetical protein